VIGAITVIELKLNREGHSLTKPLANPSLAPQSIISRRAKCRVWDKYIGKSGTAAHNILITLTTSHAIYLSSGKLIVP